MNLKLIFLCIMALDTLGKEYTPGTNTYLWQPFITILNPLNDLLLDGPLSISSAATRPILNKLPTLTQMMYYNYYAASMYFPYNHADLSCEYCLKIKKDIGHHTVLSNDFHNTIAIVALSNARKEIVVSYRGTMNLWNVILDELLTCDMIPGTMSKIKMHRGIYIATMSLYKEVVRTIGFYLNKHRNYKIVITGHSLGGAMARVTCFFIKALNQFPRANYELYTYGEPRVGNIAFADFMNSQNITSGRVVARADIFPHLPPTSVYGTTLLGDYYVHPQTQFWINGAAEQRFCDQSVYEDPTCSNSLGPAYTVLDHVIYFDVNLSSALGQPLTLTALPLKVFDPVKVIPPLPKLIENLLSGKVRSIVARLTPLIG